MKRSEMLKILESAIGNMTNICLNERELSYILRQLEQEGMLAPEAADFNLGNNWEPENEEK